MPTSFSVCTYRTISRGDLLANCLGDNTFMGKEVSDFRGFSSDIWHPVPSFSSQLWWQSCGKRSACPEAKPRGQGSCPKPSPGRGQGGFGTLHPGKMHSSKYPTTTKYTVCTHLCVYVMHCKITGWLAATWVSWPACWLDTWLKEEELFCLWIFCFIVVVYCLKEDNFFVYMRIEKV